jgi:RimJ/RimL family protein N-acetyltransferase
VDFGYAVRAGYWGQAYATEALRAGASKAGGLGIGTLWGACFAGNAASAQVMAGAGMEEVGPDADGSRRFVFPARRSA